MAVTTINKVLGGKLDIIGILRDHILWVPNLQVGYSIFWGDKLKILHANGKNSRHGTYCILIPLRRKIRCSDLIGLNVDDEWHISGIRLQLKRKIAEGSGKWSQRNSVITGFSEQLGFEIQLKTVQKVDFSCLLDEVDVIAVLPTGFARGLLFQAFIMAGKMGSNDQATTTVYTLLNSTTEEPEIWEANGLVLLTAYLTFN